jgi:hypothetical protein
MYSRLDWNLLCSPGWPPESASEVLGLQMCITKINFILLLAHLKMAEGSQVW